MDLVETEADLVLRADLPGLTRDDVQIEIKDGALTVSGERKSEHEDKAEGYHRVERTFGSFARSMTLPEGVDADSVTADFADGVLEIRVPKPAERKPHRVEIGAGSVDGTATEK
jgi:HSP20 family protein